MMRVLASVLVLSLTACSSEEASGGGGQAGAGGTAGAAGAAGAAGSFGGPCSQDPTTPAPGAVCLQTATGRVVDASGAPVPKLLTSVCGPVCFYGESGDDGRFSVPIDFHVLPSEYSTQPHGRPSLTSFYFPLPSQISGDTVDVGDLLVLPLPQTGPELVVKQDNQGAPAQTVTSGDVTLEVSDGVAVRIDVEDAVLGAEGKMFRALAIPAEHRDAFVDPALGLSALYALTPFEAAMLDAASEELAQARLSFANTGGLAAGSKVEVLALGSYQYADWVTPASFEPVATATVSGDGSTIELDAGAGVPYLTWVGLRAMP